MTFADGAPNGVSVMVVILGLGFHQGVGDNIFSENWANVPRGITQN